MEIAGPTGINFHRKPPGIPEDIVKPPRMDSRPGLTDPAYSARCAKTLYSVKNSRVCIQGQYSVDVKFVVVLVLVKLKI